MADAAMQNIDYCSDLLRRQDEDRWLVARYASPPLRNTLTALGALRLELRRIPASVSEPALGEIRLQWWREAFEEMRRGKPARAHPVVSAIASSPLHEAKFADRIDAMIDAAARPLYGEGFSTAGELGDWLALAEGSADALAVILAGGGDALVHAAENAGVAFALAREGAHLAPNLGEEISVKAQNLYSEQVQALANAKAATVPAIMHLSLTPDYLRRSGRAFPLRKRVKLFSTMAFGRF